jgi:tripartite-type tricarboxylate transporter receptor subunit TctC
MISSKRRGVMQQKNKAAIGLIISFVSVCVLSIGGSHAQDYPKSPIQIVIPFAPGGATDILWRSISDHLAKNINGSVSLVNKAGGGGVVGTSFVVNSKPDGYTLVSANSDPLNIAPVFTPDIPYNPEKDLTYLAKLALFPGTIATRADAPYKTLEELIAFARANPKKLKAGVAGMGTKPHMNVELFNREANIEIIPIPFGGGGEAVTNLLGGHVDIGILSIPSVKSHALSGKARILAVFSPIRSADFPQVPTMGERGYKSSNITTGVGLAGPKGMAPAIARKWEDVLEKTMKDPKVVAVVDKIGGLMIDFKNGEGYKKEILADLAVFKEMIPTLPGRK